MDHSDHRKVRGFYEAHHGGLHGTVELWSSQCRQRIQHASRFLDSASNIH